MSFLNSLPKEQIAGFCKNNHIKKMAVFGSILTDRFGPNSDVDFLAEFDPDHIPNLFKIVDMEEQLAEIIGKKVDLRTPKDMSHFFRDEVISKAKVIYGPT
jgi:predicted nucleotidyltransferase